MSFESWRERSLIEWLAESVPSLDVAGGIGIGDDCAALPIAPARLLLATTDLLVEGVHFRPDFGPSRIWGRRAAGVSISDIAAMGGAPRGLLLGAALPAGLSREDAQELLCGVEEMGRRYGAPLIGGDITATPGALTLALTVLGESGPGGPLRRDGARPGDAIVVSGGLGDAAAALAALDAGLPREPWWEAAFRRLTEPEPEVALGKWLVSTRWIHGAIDLSDGVASDLGHLCRASRLGAEIDLERVPLSPEVRGLARRLEVDPLGWALAGGDDYRLLSAVPGGRVEELRSLAATAGHSLVVIGRFRSEPGLWEKDESGRLRPMERLGYEHGSES